MKGPATLSQSRRFLAAVEMRALLLRHRDAGLAFTSRVTAAVLAYATLIMVGNIASTTGYAQFALIFAATGFFGPAGLGGQETLLMKQLPPIAQQQGDRGYRETILSSARIWSATLLLFAAAAVSYGFWVLGTSSGMLLVLLAALVVANGLVEIGFATQRGGGAMLPAVFGRELLWRLVMISLLAACWLIGPPSVGALSPVLCYLAGLLASISFLAWYLVPRWRIAGAAGSHPAAASPLSTSGRLWGISLLNHAVPQIDALLIGAILGASDELAAYFSAQRIVQILYFFQYGISTAVAPEVPLRYVRGDLDGLRQLSRRVSHVAGLCVVPVAALLWLYGGAVLSLFRPEFSDHASLLVVLCVGPVVYTMGGLHSVIPALCGLERDYFRLRLLLTMSFTAIKVFALLHGNILMFAWCSVLDVCVVTVAGILLTRRRIGIWTF